MAYQGQTSYLPKMPLLVIEKILSDIPNRLNVSRTCRCLYEVVCGMEKHKRVMHIKENTKTGSAPRLTIDDDAVLDSVMSTHRPIKEIKLGVDFTSDFELNEERMERITAILKQFGATTTSLTLSGLKISINSLLKLLQQLPRLESLTFTMGKVLRWATEQATISLQLSSLKKLQITGFYGLMPIVNLIPAGSLNYYHSVCGLHQSSMVLETIVKNQHNIKCLTIDRYNSDLTVLCVDHLQLESLTLKSDYDNDDKLMEVLKCHKTLKELRLEELNASLFKWICNNLKELKVFEVCWLKSLDGKVFASLPELKKLRHFRARGSQYLQHNGVLFKIDSLEKIAITGVEFFGRDERLTQMVDSILKCFTSLTHLKMSFDDMSALSFVLNHCDKVTHLTSRIRDPNPHHLIEQSFPSVQHLQLYAISGLESISIVHAMPNLNSLTLAYSILTYDIYMMNEFVDGCKNLEYFYVNRFEVYPDLPADEIIETMRCLLNRLKGYQIMFYTPLSRTVKDILSGEFNVRDVFDEDVEAFYFLKGQKRKFHNWL